MTSTRRRSRPAPGLLLLIAAILSTAGAPLDVVSSPADVRQEISPKTPRTGPRLIQGLADPVPGVSWKNAPLRRVVRQLADGFAVSVLCDRRIDPTTTLDVNAANLPLRAILEEIAHDAGGDFRLVGNTVYIGPPDSTAIVRTVAELRKREISETSTRRAATLLQSRSVHWNDLTEPVEIMWRIADRFDLKIENPELLPHDLWAGSVLPEMTASEMLTLVLIQFDLTFAWSEDLTSIRLAPLPKNRQDIAIEQVYPNVQRLDQALADWKDASGALDAERSGQQIVVRGPLELHEMIEQVRSGGAKSKPRSTRNDINTVPLARRQFTLKISRVPAAAVVKKLEQSGVVFEYDAGALSNAGIDLNTLVSFDVVQADAETFFARLFDPLKLSVEIEGVTVKLRPATP
ncbi:MAG: hypothetical protein WBC44_05000 [Planctomycetaceae bacterium]